MSSPYSEDNHSLRGQMKHHSWFSRRIIIGATGYIYSGIVGGFNYTHGSPWWTWKGPIIERGETFKWLFELIINRIHTYEWHDCVLTAANKEVTDDEIFSCFVIVYEKRLNVQGSKYLIRGYLFTSMFRTAGNFWKDFVNMSIYVTCEAHLNKKSQLQWHRKILTGEKRISK